MPSTQTQTELIRFPAAIRLPPYPTSTQTSTLPPPSSPGKDVDVAPTIAASLKSAVEEGPGRLKVLRGLAWRVFFGILPDNATLKEWTATITVQRREYDRLKTECAMELQAAQAEMEAYQEMQERQKAEEEAEERETELEKELRKRRSKIDSPQVGAGRGGVGGARVSCVRVWVQ